MEWSASTKGEQIVEEGLTWPMREESNYVPVGGKDRSYFIMGYRQAGRHSNLTAAHGSSNLPSPVTSGVREIGISALVGEGEGNMALW